MRYAASVPRGLAWLSIVPAIIGCGPDATPPPVIDSDAKSAVVDAQSAIRPVTSGNLPPLFDRASHVPGSSADWTSLQVALDRNLQWLRGRPKQRSYSYGERQVSVEELLRALTEVRGWLDEEPSPEVFASRVVQTFEVVESVGRAGTSPGERGVLVTGYYEPEIEASPRRSRDYSVPIYGPPGGLIRADLGQWSDDWRGRRIAGLLRGGRLVPFPDRAALREDPILRGREIAWARDEVDLFFLEIQGSGRLRYPDGTVRRVGYAGANGRTYRSIGKLLIDEGAIPRQQMSMQSLRKWLAENPEHIRRVLDFNQSVVFFRFLSGEPVGNLGFPVTPGRSVAVDQSLLPPGGFGFLVTDLPKPSAGGGSVVEGPLTRFVLAQDTGGAIRGADRADFFWGPGEEAAARAGVMKQPGRLLFFLPRTP
ncbi:MAG: MltA domain-containing protein [Thermoanaerobaculia bacterium]|nr:MltA domain-containing protein [Thermoanaerobaculia bacterium]